MEIIPHLLIAVVLDFLINLYISHQCSYVCHGTLVEYRNETDKFYSLMNKLFEIKAWQMDEEFAKHKNLEELKATNRKLMAIKRKRERQHE